MLRCQPFVEMMDELGLEPYWRDACRDGAPWRKPVAVVVADKGVGDTTTAEREQNNHN